MSDGLHIFGLAKSTYYSYASRREENERMEAEKRKILDNIKGCIRAIIIDDGYTAGYRYYYTKLRRDYHLDVSEQTVRLVMKEMSLEKNVEKFKKSKNKKERRCHPCDAVKNEVNQNFYREPRKVILTDITYLWCDLFKKKFYLCVFYDCYTKEALGWGIRTDMSVQIVKEAYDMMMKDHGDELKNIKEVYIHSDQGSVYTSTEFRTILEKDKFIQSMSERGNSQDNAPMESFFGRTKEKILDILALAPDFITAKIMLEDYLERYNDTYQYYLAGLSPKEFYLYKKTGVYPCPEYFGVSAEDLHDLDELIQKRIDAQRKRNQQQRENYANRRKEEQQQLTKPPVQVVEEDISTLEKMISKQKRIIEKAEEKKKTLEEIKEKAKKALEFLKNASEELLKKLSDPFKWREHPELSYVHDMNGMF